MWEVDTALEKISSKIENYSLPNKPTTFGKDYSFPDDITRVTSHELGQWMFKLASWKGYTLRMLALAESEHSLVEDSYNVLLAKIVSEIDNGKRFTKEVLTGKALTSDKNLRKLKIRLMESSSEVMATKRILDIYTMQIEIVSREISRRSLDLKIHEKGL